MSDIFQIKGVDSVLKIGDKEYPFADPPFLAKNRLLREMKELEKSKGEMSLEDELALAYEINLKMINQYLPSLPQEIIDSMGENTVRVLINKISDLSAIHFGAVVEKIEKK